MSAESRDAGEATDIFRRRFEAVFDAHHADVLAFASRRIGGRAAAEDVVSEAFAVVWRRRDVIPDEPLPWLYAIARRVLANQHRAAGRRGRLRERLRAEAATATVGRDPAGLVDERDLVVAAFAKLSEGEREVLRLIAWDGVDTTAGAQILDCTPGAFRVRLYRARRRLRRALAESEQDASSHSMTQRAPAQPEEAR